MATLNYVHRKFTGAVIVQDELCGDLSLMIFQEGQLDAEFGISSDSLGRDAKKEAKSILKDNDYEDLKIYQDQESLLSEFLYQIRDYENISPCLNDGYEPEDDIDDDYDGSIESYFSDPNHWPD